MESMVGCSGGRFCSCFNPTRVDPTFTRPRGRKSCFGSSDGFGLHYLEISAEPGEPSQFYPPKTREEHAGQAGREAGQRSSDGRGQSRGQGGSGSSLGTNPGAALRLWVGDELCWCAIWKFGAGNCRGRAVPCPGRCGQPERRLRRRGRAAIPAPGCDSAVTQAGDACGVALGSIPASTPRSQAL